MHLVFHYRLFCATKRSSLSQHQKVVEKGLTSHSTQFRSFRRRCFTGLMTQPTVSKHWRRVVSHPDRPQCNQVHLTVLQYYNMQCTYNTRKVSRIWQPPWIPGESGDDVDPAQISGRGWPQTTASHTCWHRARIWTRWWGIHRDTCAAPAASRAHDVSLSMRL